nr:nicotinate-nucleotide adenylyltransferase [Pseudoduganella ginsengisoli]
MVSIIVRCIALLGGTFDPVHLGHVALATHWMHLLGADELRVLPALPWQKASLGATAQQRADMAQLAFTGQPYPVVIDCQEIERGTPTFTVDTLRNLRRQLGTGVSLAFLMGADQLQKLDTWRDWQALFELAHICAAARPGFSLEQLPQAVQDELNGRMATPERVRTTPAGCICLAPDLALDMSSTGIRAALQRGEQPDSLISPVVLDYIEQHNLYK